MRVVKVCGITTLEDALFAEQCGAAYLGFIFVKSSPRYINPAQAKLIIDRLTQAKAVGVFVDSGMEDITALAQQIGLSAVQCYQPIECKMPGVQSIQAIKVEDSVDNALLHNPNADYVLLDASHQGKFGGQGLQFDWSLLPADRSRLFLAGGIKLENVETALAQQTYAIDVNSGVESSPGKKDHHQLQQLMTKVQSYE